MIDNRTSDKYEIISFDIFDTLIKRLVVKPTDIFRYIERSDEKYKGFCMLRIKAEEDARKKSDKEEVTIDEIYKKIPSGHGWDIEVLKELEKNTEINFCVPNYPVVNFLNEVKSTKKILLISDMYLGNDVITKILTKCGITGVDGIYISSECGACKNTGNLYKLIKNELHIDFSKWMHIGDNKVSDYRIPKKMGISSYLYKMNDSTYDNNADFDKMILSRYVELKSKRFEDKIERMGYTVYGPILYGFSKWIHDKILKNKNSIVLFIARDGYILKVLYDKIFKDFNYKSRYLLASRRSLWLSSFKGNVELKAFYNRIVTEFPKSFKLQLLVDEFELNDLVEDTGSYLNYVVDRDNALEDKSFTNFFYVIQAGLNKRSNEEYQAFLQYIDYLNIETNEKIAIVDIGWRGTMQFMLEKIFDKNLYGYYYGINNKRYHLKHVYAYNNEWNKTANSMTTFLELFFSANHGSFKKYKHNLNGTVGFEFKKFEHENKTKTILNKMRDGALEFVKDCYNDKLISGLTFTAEITATNLVNQLKFPSREDVEAYEKIKFYDIKKDDFIKNRNLSEYLFSPKLFLNDYRASIWKIGFLKRVFMVDIPYYKLIEIVNRLKTIISCR